ncbi:hypothetical protein QCN29_17875 [Streptomyces sp. HNM0663]|uniref:Transposase n=1 Tax=Streptomyces chengmaiensis TaxID=3040919 RepID=A0ABT6HPH5_9ACTN|nr:hypothetical protein [Streptomyces chengmaiensis]MDH2390626.1 hypothetical protein [Streptomyces chengmaiensis]
MIKDRLPHGSLLGVSEHLVHPDRLAANRRLRAAAEAVDELWSSEEEIAERYGLFLTCRRSRNSALSGIL